MFNFAIVFSYTDLSDWERNPVYSFPPVSGCLEITHVPQYMGQKEKHLQNRVVLRASSSCVK